MDLLINGARPLIAMFDSGIGGLNLLKVCAQKIPQADFAYFADNYRVPYGNLPHEEIKRLTFSAFSKIAKLNPVAAAVACNTVTAECVNDLRAAFKFPIAGVQPAVKQAAGFGGKFLVLATCATANSLSFKNLLAQYGKNAVVRECHSLASEIEENIFCLDNFPVEKYFFKGDFSCVVLGCTHYIFIADRLKKLYGCPIFDGMVGTADHLLKISGIGDHQSADRQKITFHGGDFNKNRAVYDKICH